MAAVTLSEVARAAGVSPATASRVLNGSSRTPGADIADRVRAAADALGYIANAQAQALARSSSGLLGLIVHDIADPYFSSIARGVQSAARELGKTLLLICTEGTPAEERLAVEAFTSRRTDAIVLAGSRSARPEDADDNAALLRESERYLANGGRLVLVGHDLIDNRPGRGALRAAGPGGEAGPWDAAGPGGATGPGDATGPATSQEQHGEATIATAAGASPHLVVDIPNESLAFDLARALSRQGHTRFAVVAGPEGLMTSDLRLAGFQRGLAEGGLGPAEVTRAGFNREGGFKAGLSLESAVRGAAAEGSALCIFAVNDRMAMGVVAALRQQGLEAPADYSVAGFDDINTLEDFFPGLTTVRLPLEDIGRTAAEAALTTGGHGPTAGSVILRESTGRKPA
ncbi:LacI family DNA-binding transcriptional regulator [Sinomonas sp. G460-2]|uniref:LacI family DNA-binding transcriptional regulator n=1 Tax=Sinomonas sp. G460-2 TaxID=3393464 RepID=UPI0039EE2C2E